MFVFGTTIIYNNKVRNNNLNKKLLPGTKFLHNETKIHPWKH